MGPVSDEAGHFRGREARLTVNYARQRIANDRLADLTAYASKGRDRIRKWRRRILNRINGRGIPPQNDGAGKTCRCCGVGEADAADENIARSDARRRLITVLA